MQKLALPFVLAALLALTTIHPATAQTGPRVYIMMKDGKLSEMVDGKKEVVTKDINLTNGTTVHPDGRIDDKDGNKKTLNEGEYMTMDGRVRLLRNMAAGAPTTTPATTTTTATAKPATKVKPKPSGQ
jgi:hypothetical protein